MGIKLKAFDLFVLSSLWEGLPRVIPQAMASSVPIVASRLDGISEAITDGKTGLLVPPGDHQVLADRIIQVLADRSWGAQLASAAQQETEEFELSKMLTSRRTYSPNGRAT